MLLRLGAPALINWYWYLYTSYTQGLAISNSETIRAVHNGFSRQEPFFNDGQDGGGKKEDVFHFVAYLPHEDKASWLSETFSIPHKE